MEDHYHPKSYRYSSHELSSEVRTGKHADDAEQLHTSRLRSYIPRTTNTLLFTLLTVVQACICIGLEIKIILGVTPTEDMGNLMTLPRQVELAQFCPVVFECLYQIFSSMDAARSKNIIQVIGLCFNNCSMTILVALVISNDTDFLSICEESLRKANLLLLHKSKDRLFRAHIEELKLVIESAKDIKNLLIGTTTTMAGVTLCLFVFAWRLSSDFKWYIRKHVDRD